MGAAIEIGVEVTRVLGNKRLDQNLPVLINTSSALGAFDGLGRFRRRIRTTCEASEDERRAVDWHPQQDGFCVPIHHLFSHQWSQRGNLMIPRSVPAGTSTGANLAVGGSFQFQSDLT